MVKDSKLRQHPAKSSASPLLVGGVVAALALVMLAILSLQLHTGRLPEESDSMPAAEAPDKKGAPTEKEIAAAIAAFNPRFKVRKVEDYSPKVQAEAASHQRQPFMLLLDVNRDGTADVVLDGHDDQRSILLCLLSSPDGYRAVVVRESALATPQGIESWNVGVKQTGLNYHLWPHGTGTGFTLAFPQQSDPAGTLLNDGAIIDYTFDHGTFSESTQVP